MSIAREEGPWLRAGETLLCFGDSLTAAAKGYVKTLQDELQFRGVKVLNAGLGGDKTPLALTRLKTDVIDRKPDAVSIFFGNNDSLIGRGEWRDEPVISPLTFEENLKWIIHLCRLLGGIRKFSINTVTGRLEGRLYHEFGDLLREYCLAARRAADSMSARLVPLDTVFADLREKNRGSTSPEGLLYTKDGLHMNDEGYAIIARTMLREWNLL